MEMEHIFSIAVGLEYMVPPVSLMHCRHYYLYCMCSWKIMTAPLGSTSSECPTSIVPSILHAQSSTIQTPTMWSVHYNFTVHSPRSWSTLHIDQYAHMVSNVWSLVVQGGGPRNVITILPPSLACICLGLSALSFRSYFNEVKWTLN